jgi:hypothetical protein
VCHLMLDCCLFFSKYLEEPCLWVETNNTTLSLLSSNAEIALGFLLIISLLSYVDSAFHTIGKVIRAVSENDLTNCTFAS